MSELSNIKPGMETKMTEELKRLFAYAGCGPTICHACEKTINVGHLFRLIPHQRKEQSNREIRMKTPSAMLPFYREPHDEMVCSKCGEIELTKRDRRQERDWKITRTGGFSRPSAPHQGEEHE